ncbi:hypothetical protein [Arthrobacter zhaoguopingii]|uniref:hypothetical protein n=1 Tax=Arthrobacter zhaoguopingii TaxID=2681491 RepID=UPI0013578405|nr:hypothetical protein [Arthrobacter zhaoguopingii]
MNLQLILRTNLKWFVLINTLSTLAFLPVLNHLVVTGATASAGITGAAYGAVWFISGLVTGIADNVAARQHHPRMSYAAFSLLMAIVVFLAGKLLWPAVMPLSWTAVLLYSFLCAAATLVIQLRMRRTHQGYSGKDLFN